MAQQLAQALRLEQVAYIKQQLLNTNNNTFLKNFIYHLYLHADHIQLQDVILLEQLQQVVQKYAFDLNLGPELLEFIGVAARKVHHLIRKSTLSYQDLMSDQIFEHWVFKLFELEQFRQHLKVHLYENSKVQLICLQLANQIVEHNTPWLQHFRTMNIKSTGLSAKVFNFIQDQQQNIELKLEQQLAQAILKQLGHIITLPNEELSEICLTLWSELKHHSVKHSFAQIDAIDIEEVFTLVYETWKSLRQNVQMQQLILSVVEAFYSHFGTYTLQALLLAVGVQEEDLYEEAERFAPHVFYALEQRGLLDGMIDALVSPFYAEQRTLDLILPFLNQPTP